VSQVRFYLYKFLFFLKREDQISGIILFVFNVINRINLADSQTQGSRGLRSESEVARLLELRVRIPTGHGCLSVMSVVDVLR
jgi:hypothetical protein